MSHQNPFAAIEGVPHIRLRNLNAYYGNLQALRNISMEVDPFSVLALIGPSGCGKTTLLRVLNRMNDLIEGYSMDGFAEINHTNLYNPDTRLELLRKQVGMVFQKPNPFPKSVFENVAFGLRIQGISQRNFLEEKVAEALQKVGLWEEVRDQLKKNALSLSGGQQQRLCIARALAVEPSILLMDEPTSSLDPVSTGKIEDLIFELKNDYTILIVTHNMQQAARISDQTAFLFSGHLVEKGKTRTIFTNPEKRQTESFISGHFS